MKSPIEAITTSHQGKACITKDLRKILQGVWTCHGARRARAVQRSDSTIGKPMHADVESPLATRTNGAPSPGAPASRPESIAPDGRCVLAT
ncbi:hypothetical protein [Gemmatimonas sp.]|uniref:hypothetical protein n=1 Tax=Gemmatimonas sp. TaxID=1962908 RepID=UPI0025BE095A|nr:hypothetical protein [Gemmatimonas sp.]